MIKNKIIIKFNNKNTRYTPFYPKVISFNFSMQNNFQIFYCTNTTNRQKHVTLSVLLVLQVFFSQGASRKL